MIIRWHSCRSYSVASLLVLLSAVFQRGAEACQAMHYDALKTVLQEVHALFANETD